MINNSNQKNILNIITIPENMTGEIVVRYGQLETTYFFKDNQLQSISFITNKSAEYWGKINEKY